MFRHSVVLVRSLQALVLTGFAVVAMGTGCSSSTNGADTTPSAEPQVGEACADACSSCLAFSCACNDGVEVATCACATPNTGGAVTCLDSSACSSLHSCSEHGGAAGTPQTDGGSSRDAAKADSTSPKPTCVPLNQTGCSPADDVYCCAVPAGGKVVASCHADQQGLCCVEHNMPCNKGALGECCGGRKCSPVSGTSPAEYSCQ